MKYYFDGGCIPNPGIMEIAVVCGEDKFHEILDYGTNNKAEWISFLLACEIAKNNNDKNIEVYGDSSLIVNQANGVWKCKSEELKPFLDEFNNIKNFFTSIKVQYIPRNENPAGNYIESLQKNR